MFKNNMLSRLLKEIKMINMLTMKKGVKVLEDEDKIEADKDSKNLEWSFIIVINSGI